MTCKGAGAEPGVKVPYHPPPTWMKHSSWKWQCVFKELKISFWLATFDPKLAGKEAFRNNHILYSRLGISLSCSWKISEFFPVPSLESS